MKLPPATRSLNRDPDENKTRTAEGARAFSIPIRFPFLSGAPATLRATPVSLPPLPVRDSYEATSSQSLQARRDRPARLLVLEDNTDSGELLKTLLDDQYDVTLRHTYDSALDAVRSGTFDLFVFDINLGETRTGADLLRAIRHLPEPPGTPAIACTAYGTSDDRGQSWYDSAGFNGYVRKPFEIDELFDTIERVLRRTGR